jgi:hypothetical protein
MARPVSLMDVKQALRDSRFRESLPESLKPDDQKFLSNPGCACNVPIYQRVLKDGAEQLRSYFPNRPIANLEEEVKNIAENHWRVINCKASELEAQLKKLPPGRKQLAVARYEDEVTVVVNELDVIY